MVNGLHFYNLNCNLERDFNNVINNLNTSLCVIALVNGWDPSNIGTPSDFNNTWGIFIQQFRYPINKDINTNRYQVIIEILNAKIWTREIYWDDTDQTLKFTDWVSNS